MSAHGRRPPPGAFLIFPVNRQSSSPSNPLRQARLDHCPSGRSLVSGPPADAAFHQGRVDEPIGSASSGQKTPSLPRVSWSRARSTPPPPSTEGCSTASAWRPRPARKDIGSSISDREPTRFAFRSSTGSDGLHLDHRSTRTTRSAPRHAAVGISPGVAPWLLIMLLSPPGLLNVRAVRRALFHLKVSRRELDCLAGWRHLCRDRQGRQPDRDQVPPAGHDEREWSST